MAARRRKNQSRLPVAALLGLWAFATILNLFKPFHLDDTAHLLIAQHILQDPLHPMSGQLNWLNISEPIFATNQPHFFFNLVAGVMWLFGPSELALHLLVAAFALAAIFLVFRLAQRLTPQYALAVTAGITISPGFLINQNVMVDVPLFAMMCLAVFMLTKPVLSGRDGFIGFASYSLGLLTKYTALFLYPALIWAALRSRKTLAWAVLPVVAIVAWSLFNILDFGAAHILNRPSIGRGLIPSPKLALGLTGAMAAFATPAAAMLIFQDQRIWRWLWLGVWVLSATGFTLGWTMAAPDNPAWLIGLNGLLFAGSCVLALAAGMRILALLWSFLKARKDLSAWYRRTHFETTLALWLLGGTAFLTLFAPFMATRHALLLVVPLFLLALAGRNLEPARWPTYGVFVLWGIFGAYVVANDIAFARFYARMAPVTAELGGEIAGPEGRVYTRGHWGWQWYSREYGMAEYDSELTKPRVGDVLVDPVGISAQTIDNLDDYIVVAEFKQPAGVFTLLDTHLFYAAGATPLPLLAPNPGRAVRVLKKVR